MQLARNMMAVALFATAVTVTTAESSVTAQDAPLYANDFASAAPGGEVPGWVDTTVNNSTAVDDSLFKVAAVDGNQAWSTASTGSNIHSHYTGAGAYELASYTYTGRMRVGDQRGGVGVTFLSGYPSSDTYYRLRRYGGNGSFHLSPHGTSMTAGDVDSGVVPQAGVWYRFRVEIGGDGSATAIRANVWPDGTAEPSGWQIDAADSSGTRHSAGTFGVWSHAAGVKYWDDLRVDGPEPHEPVPVTVTADAGEHGSVSVEPDQPEYEVGDQVTITATPDDGFVFGGWSGTVTGGTNPLTLELDSDVAVTAASAAPPSGLLDTDFEQDAVGDEPSGWVDTARNNSMNVDDTLFAVVDAGGTNALGTSSGANNIHSHYVTPESAGAGDYSFTGRMQVGAQGGGVGVTFLSDYPNTDTYYRLRRHGTNGAFHLSPHGTSITSGQAGTGVVPTAGVWYRFKIEVRDSGTSTDIRAKVWQDGTTEPSGWQADASDASGTRLTTGTVGVWGHAGGTKYWDDLLATPLAPIESYSVSTATTGQGSVTVDPDQASYPGGSSVTLTAEPAAGWEFAGWSGDVSGSQNPLEVTVNSDLSVTAEFTEAPPSYSVSTATTGQGSVTVDPDQASYPGGSSVTLTAEPAAGWEFTGWSGDVSGSQNPLEVTVDADLSVTAEFTATASHTVSVETQGNGSVSIDPDQPTYGPGEQVTLTAEPDQGWIFDHWTVDPPVARSWWDPAWSYRLPVTVAAAGTARTDTVAEIDVDLSAGVDVPVDPESLRVVEVGPAGTVTDAAVPFQFDPVADFDPASNAAGTVTVQLTGATAPTAERRYDIYFDRPSAGHAPAEFTDRVAVTDGVADAGEETLRIATASTTYFYDTAGGGFTSIVDRDGLDWLNYGSAAGSAGQYRGIPNMVYPEGLMHPGADGVTSTVVHDGPLKTTIRSTSAGGAWVTEWDIYPDHARMTVLAADHNYWFLYEGTPGGELDLGGDIVVRSDGSQGTAGTSWTQDLPGEEWVYFGDPGDDRSLYVANHAQDSAVDSYYPMEGNMTVFGFGRSGTGRYLNAVPAEFSIGLVDGVDRPGVSARIAQSTRPLEVSTGSAESSDGTGQLTGDVLTFGVNADHTVTAVFVETPPSTLSVTTSGPGSVTIEPERAEYQYGQEVTLTAVPDADAELVGWSGGASGTTNPLTVAVTRDTAIGAEFRVPTSDTSNPDAPTIDVWYGDQPGYGEIGVPQPYYNILGKVSDPNGVSSLSYTLNGGAPIPLSIGANSRRLNGSGDFNVDVPEQNLVPGANQVVLTAVDRLGNSGSKTVTVNYTDNVWPGEYQIDWSEASSIDDVAQVVDGKWEITPDGLRVAEPGYDRLVALGDTSWTDYEIEVPVTLHSIDPRGFSSSQSGGAGLGLLMRWNGHTDVPVAGAQPKTGWLPHGAIGWYRWTKPDQHRLRLDGNWGTLLGYSYTPQVTPGNTYIYKMRVETTGSAAGRYSLKLWEAGTPEPAAWTVTGQQGPDNPQAGSVLLLAHHVDATFGDVQITPLADSSSFTLDVTTNGSGSVSVDPDQATYAYGDQVSLTATPDAGHVFTGWSGALSGSANPATVTMNGSRQVTANFAPADQPPVISNVSVQAFVDSAVVSWRTDQPATSKVAFGETTDYELGTVSDATLRTQHSVTLTGLSPETTYHYRVTSVGDGGGSASSSDRTFSTTAVDANAFVSDDFNACALDDSVWSFVDPKGDGGLSVNGTQLELSVPGGVTHDVWTGGNMAPRVMQPVGDDDLEVEVGFESVVSAAYQMQGLIVEQDAGNLIRAEIHGRSGQAYVFVARFTNGQPTTVAQLPLGTLSSDDPRVGLRVTRNGDTWKVASSVAGGPWTDAVSFVHALSVSKAGVFAGNAGAAPAHTAKVDYVFDTAAPIHPEDPDSPTCT